MSPDLLQRVGPDRRLQARLPTYNLRRPVHVVQLGDIARYLSASVAPLSSGGSLVLLTGACCSRDLAGTVAVTIIVIGSSGRSLHLTAELLGAQAKQTAAGIRVRHRRHVLGAESVLPGPAGSGGGARPVDCLLLGEQVLLVLELGRLSVLAVNQLLLLLLGLLLLLRMLH